MTRTYTRVVLGVAAVLVAAGVYASAQDQNTNQPRRPFMGGPGPGRFGGPDGGMGLLPMLPRELNLTDSQREQVRSIAMSHRDEWKALADRARPAHEALMAAVMADSIDEGLIRAKSAEVANVEADMHVARAHAFAEVARILTADQKAKLKELAGHRRGPGRGRGPAF